MLLGLFLLALPPRLVGIDTYFTSDEGYWAHRTVRFAAGLSGGDLAATYRSGHPGVTVMWVGILGAGPDRLGRFDPSDYRSETAFQREPGYLDTVVAARRGMAVVTAALTTLVVALAWTLLGPGPALVGGLLLLLDPYLVGVSQLLHVDALLAPLMSVATLAGLIYWLRGREPRYLLLSAAAGGLALLTKAPAAFIPIFLGLVALGVARPWRCPTGVLTPLLAWGAIAAVVYVVLWPTLWVDPIGGLTRVARFALTEGGTPHDWRNYFLGQIVTEDPGPLYYPVALAFRLSPIAIVGLLGLLVQLRRAERRTAVLWLAAYVLLFAGLMTLGAKKFDRYMLPAIFMLDILAGVGLWGMAKSAKRPALAAALLVIPLAVQVAVLARAYPYPLASYNPLLGGIAGARQAILVGWGEGLDQVAAYLNAQPDADQLVAATQYHNVLRPVFQGWTVRIVDPSHLDYYVVYINMDQRHLVPPAVEEAMAAGPPEFTAYVHGEEYARVYRVTTMVEDLPGPSEPEGEEGELP